MFSRIFRTIFYACVLLLVFGAAIWHQEIADWWVLRSYEPTDKIARIANRAAFSDSGKDYFYVSDPRVNDEKEFNRNCKAPEKGFVLGCYSGKQIFILDVQREELDGIVEVTAAHEMLHAAYDRLSSRERSRVNGLLEEEFSRVEDEKIIDLIKRYEKSGGPDVRKNELHSILPTQKQELSPELEEYFSQYFTNRQQVASLYKDYESTFVQIRKDIEDLRGRVENMREEIESLEARLDQQQQRVDSLNRQIERHEARGDTESRNELVPQQNQAVEEYNSLASQYRSLISEHNRLVDELNETVLLQRDLVESMDSTL